MKLVDTKDAVGTVLCHDITQIIKGVTKDARFRKGHVVKEEDIPVLLSLGKDHLYVWEAGDDMLHENDAARILCDLCKNEGMKESEVKEGKIELSAEYDGLLKIEQRKTIYRQFFRTDDDRGKIWKYSSQSRGQTSRYENHSTGH